MRQPKRSDDKYWTGTRIFHEEQFISDLQDHIDNLNERIQALSIPDVIKSLPTKEEIDSRAEQALFGFEKNSRQFDDDYHIGYCDGADWMKRKITK